MIEQLLSLIYRYAKYRNGEYPLGILYYHHVLPEKDLYHHDEVTVNEFEKQIQYLTKHFKILSMTDALQKLQSDSLPPKAITITFDDGYQDNFDYAAPILEKYNCPATFFVATEGIEKGYLWNDMIEQCVRNTKTKAVPATFIGEPLDFSSVEQRVKAGQQLINNLKNNSSIERQNKIFDLIQLLNIGCFKRVTMTAEQISELSRKGFEIGAHSHSHTILSYENLDICKREINESKKILESVIKKSVTLFPYPNGKVNLDFNSQHCMLIKEFGFKAAFSTEDKGCFSKSNLTALPRFMTFRKSLPLFAISIATNANNFFTNQNDTKI